MAKRGHLQIAGSCYILEHSSIAVSNNCLSLTIKLYTVVPQRFRGIRDHQVLSPCPGHGETGQAQRLRVHRVRDGPGRYRRRVFHEFV